MSSHATVSNQSTTDDDEDPMEFEKDAITSLDDVTCANLGEENGNLAIVLRDSTNWLLNVKALRETDVLILLTPVVNPISQKLTDVNDPFEPLGRSLAKRHARIRHVPYTQRNGITSTHLGFIKRGQVIIFCFVLKLDERIQLDFADIAFAVSDNKPCIIVVCCSPITKRLSIPFPTVIQTTGYTPEALEAAAAAIFSENTASLDDAMPKLTGADRSQPRLWPVEQWDEARDISTVLDLWRQSLTGRFSVDMITLASLLRRPGYAKHYVVRDSRSEEALGFCATYLSYVDQEGEKLIASLAILLVRSSSRQQGVGLSLHNHALGQLKKTRGVTRVQLGSVFPRLLYGPPVGINMNEDWFRRRGWQLSKEVPGQGQAVCDLILNFSEWRYVVPGSISNMPQFRPCSQGDVVKVLAMVEQVAIKQDKMGWFDQYLSLLNGPNVKDIVLGIEKDNIVAAALTYIPYGGSPIASNLPWAGLIGDDIGGVTCICINPPRQDATIIGLLDACVKNIQSQGMRRMFLDGVADALDDFKRLGFTEWARYRDVWKDI